MAYPVVCRTRLQSVRESNDDTVNSTRALLKPFLDVRLVELARGKKARKQRYTVFIGLINQLTVEFGGPANIDNLRIPTVKGNFPIPGSRCRGKEYLALTAYFGPFRWSGNTITAYSWVTSERWTQHIQNRPHTPEKRKV